MFSKTVFTSATFFLATIQLLFFVGIYRTGKGNHTIFAITITAAFKRGSN
jgi:hypothetical protein